MQVKICGITTLEDALAACEAGADALGFNFAQQAKRKSRYIEPDVAAEIARELPAGVETVAVTVNAETKTLREYLERFDWVQLHGNETPAQCAALGGQIIKAFRVGPDFGLERVRPYAVGQYLLDASVPGEPGGTGQLADWGAARRVAEVVSPVILAGGLNPENVAEAIAAVRPSGVDTAGGVEVKTEPGKKDHERIREFVLNAKASLS